MVHVNMPVVPTALTTAGISQHGEHNLGHPVQFLGGHAIHCSFIINEIVFRIMHRCGCSVIDRCHYS